LPPRRKPCSRYSMSDDPCGRSDDDLRLFSDVIGEIVNQYLGEIPST